MTYTFFLVDGVTAGALAAALGSALGVAAEAVDVADADVEMDHRDWSAPVLCDSVDALGDLAQLIEIQVERRSAAEADRPSEPTYRDLAGQLARTTGTAVLWHGEERIPSAYWVMTPEGATARARVTEHDDAPAPRYTVPIVESAVAQLPRARVEALPELLQEEKFPTPVTDAFAAAADPEGSAPAESVANRAREGLLLWERLVRRMAGDWAPSGRYRCNVYVADLRTRDHLGLRVEQAREAARTVDAPAHASDVAGRLERSLGELDAVFQAHTVDAAEAPWPAGAPCPPPGSGWWWRRRPSRVPW